MLIIEKETTHYTNNKSVNNRKRQHTTLTIKVLIIEKTTHYTNNKSTNNSKRNNTLHTITIKKQHTTHNN